MKSSWIGPIPYKTCWREIWTDNTLILLMDRGFLLHIKRSTIIFIRNMENIGFAHELAKRF
jgi:hypothetical protein